MDKLQCNMCDEYFNVKSGYYPYECEFCKAVFCGDECCGVFAVFIETLKNKGQDV